MESLCEEAKSPTEELKVEIKAGWYEAENFTTYVNNYRRRNRDNFFNKQILDKWVTAIRHHLYKIQNGTNLY